MNDRLWLLVSSVSQSDAISMKNLKTQHIHFSLSPLFNVQFKERGAAAATMWGSGALCRSTAMTARCVVKGHGQLITAHKFWQGVIRERCGQVLVRMREEGAIRAVRDRRRITGVSLDVAVLPSSGGFCWIVALHLDDIYICHLHCSVLRVPVVFVASYSAPWSPAWRLKQELYSSTLWNWDLCRACVDGWYRLSRILNMFIYKMLRLFIR